MKRQKLEMELENNKKIKAVATESCGAGGCSFWNEKKNRFCKMVTKTDTKFCGQHLPGSEGRTECPHCNSSIQLTRIEKHLKKCNILKEMSIVPNYFQKGIRNFAITI